jgi:hypothetical protein
MDSPYRVDHNRLGATPVGIKVGDTDIAHLDAPSLLRWLRHRGGCNPWAENIIGLMLHHEHQIVPGCAAPTLVPAELF